MPDSKRPLRIPVSVLERARKVSEAPRPPSPPALMKPSRHPREKIVQALKKLHPMD